MQSRGSTDSCFTSTACCTKSVQEQLRLEQDNYSTAESLRKQLEVQLREITIRLDEAESTKDGKKPVAKLQARVNTQPRAAGRRQRNQLFISATLRFDSAVQCHLTA